MEYTKKQVEAAILNIAANYGKFDNYKAMIEAGISLPRLVEMISYELFLQVFSWSGNKEGILNESYSIILQYGLELRDKGMVTFKG